MRSLRVAWGAAGAAVLAVVSLTHPVWAQPSPQAARVTYDPPPGEITVNEITAFVSLPDMLTPGQKLYISVTGPGAKPREVAATPGCQPVRVSLPENGNYEVAIETEIPLLVDAAGKCSGGGTDPGKFVVKVPPKVPASPTSVAAAPKSPGTAGRGRAGPGGKGGGASIAGIDVGRFEADFDRLQGKAAGGPAGAPGEEGFQNELRYTEAGEREEELGAAEERGARRNTLAFIAGGLLALVTFLFLRVLRSEVDRQPLPV